MMFNDMESDALHRIDSSKTLDELSVAEQYIFGRKSGTLSLAMQSLRDVSSEDRKAQGAFLNEVKERITQALEKRKRFLEDEKYSALYEKESVDITLPHIKAIASGHLHPVTQVTRMLTDVFSRMGFLVVDGPELESEYYTFESVNIPSDHPARDMQDTFYISGHPNWVMRTHTSSMQVRSMRKYGVPLRMIAPGRCFRNEATDARHEHTFYQLEGLMVGKGISFAHLKGVLEVVARELYGEETQVRLRPKYYPFVEPGVNGEVSCFLCHGGGCRVCKGSGWLEVFGAGMVHPHVLREGGADPDAVSGFAFGFGLTRLVMLKYGIDDIRHLQSGDIRFLKQF